VYRKLLKSRGLPPKEPKKVKTRVGPTPRNNFHINQKRQGMSKQPKTQRNCEYCDKPIPSVRLEALPDAEYCVQCATKIQSQSRDEYIPSRDILETIERDDISDD